MDSSVSYAAEFQAFVRKFRAERILSVLGGLDNEIVAAIAQKPKSSDKEIARRFRIDFRRVERIRRRYQIPNLFSSGMNDEPELHKLYCKFDDALLDDDVCQVNLYGEERARYMELLNRKKRCKK